MSDIGNICSNIARSQAILTHRAARQARRSRIDLAPWREFVDTIQPDCEHRAMAVGMRDVARAAGVSVATVSNALNRPDQVAPATLAKIRQAITALGFVRNASAAQLRAGYSRTIGLLVPDISNPFFTDIARGVEDAANARNYVVFLCNSDEDTKREERYLQVLLEQRVRGVLFTPTSDEADHILSLRQQRMPFTLLDRESSSDDECSVAVDDERGAEMAINHLVELGHRHIGWVNGPHTIPQCAARGRGIERSARVASVKITSLNVPLMNTAAGEKVAAEFLAINDRPTALFCANDLLALGVMRSLLTAGVSIPHEVSLIGYDDIAFCASAAVPLSSIAQPAYQLGMTATGLLLEECEAGERHAHQRVMFQPRLVARASSGAASAG
jgi:LacI family transcriptional regulator